MYGNSYLNMQHLGAGHISFVLTRVFDPRTITTVIFEKRRFLWPIVLLSSADITKYKHPFFSSQCL